MAPDAFKNSVDLKGAVLMKERLRMHCTMSDPNFKDLVFGIATLLFFVALLALTPKYGGTANAQALTSGATSKTYPYIISTAGILVSLYLIISKGLKIIAACRKEMDLQTSASEASKTAAGPRFRWRMVVSCVLMMFVLNVLLIKLGLVAGGFVYLFIQILILTARKDLTKKNILIALLVSICVPLMIYFPFRYIFKAKIPMGIFK